jgi:DNA invertase Pin-like site-specific DNA recombinase
MNFNMYKDKKFIGYVRASTESQRGGIGLEVQRESINKFIAQYGGTVVAIEEEIISGGAAVRDGFDRALQLCKFHGAVLIVHRIDRLSRAGFMTIARLDEEGIPFIEADSPHDTTFSKHIKFLVAKEEKDKTRQRVKDALGQIKGNINRDGFHITKEGKRITSLGNPQNLSDEARERSKRTRRAKAIADQNNVRAYAMASRMRSENSLKQIADALNKGGFKTSRGNRFYPIQVSNLIDLYEK